MAPAQTSTDPCTPEDAARVLSLHLAAATSDAERRRLRDELVLCTLATADALAHRYRGRGVDVEDLEQVARTALVSAAQRYDPSVGSGFAASAVPWISGELKRYFRDHTWAVRPPRRLQELRLARNGVEADLRHRLQREPTTAEVADALGSTADEVHESRASSAAYRSTSLDLELPGGGTVGDRVRDPSDAPAEVDTHDALARAVAGLSDRDRRLLHLRFDDELTQSEIGLLLGVRSGTTATCPSLRR